MASAAQLQKGLDKFTADNPWIFDLISEFDGVKVAVDSESMTMLDGAEIDYRDGLEGAGFAINNHNVANSCGCGNSFS